MQIYHATNSHLFCGHWNGSPLEIGLTGLMRGVPRREAYHYHDYHEYYVILRGRGRLKVEGRAVPLEPNTVVMIQPGERHRVVWVDPDEGIQWLILKERSAPDSKVVVREDERGTA
ncbi:MAG: cupin domain-containing protein [Chloroflexi bacterium]|nr:cupin domain-containing protein [Chloroflexota bacterium]MBI3732625.1 cupin domain-containing protein [Chloroflexota bacterium]